MRKYLTLLIVMGMIIVPYLSNLSTATISPSNVLSLKIPESHFIEGVPYVGQTEGYFCYYASCAMIFNYLGLNTSLDEILFYDGLGYSHYYLSDERLPKDGCYLGDFDFVLDLFGLAEESWHAADEGLGEDELWEQYYCRLKENISNDVPVMAIVDPFSLPSLEQQFIVPNLLWDILFTPSVHVIVVVGYDENNQSICYCDPNAGFYGDESLGDHAWMSLSDFRKAVENNVWYRYGIWIIKQINDPLPKKEAFEKAFLTNIEKLKGNISAYYYEKGSGGFDELYGINASKQLKNDFSKGEENRIETINLYKKYGDTGLYYSLLSFMKFLFSVIFPNRPSIFDIFMVGKVDSFESIAAEKNHVADYLEHNAFYPELCEKQASLLKEESDNWIKLSDYYKVFMRRGISLSFLRAENLMIKMEEIIDNIITIEQTIIDESVGDY